MGLLRKSRKASTPGSQCTTRLPAEVKELVKKEAKPKKTGAAASTSLESRGENRATAAGRQVATLEVEFAETKTAPTRKVDVAAPFKTDAGELHEDFRSQCAA